MCRSLQTNFFHNCGHVQNVTIPSTNPTCERVWASREYINDYCPRCKTLLGHFMYPQEYTELGPGINCNVIEGEIIRTVRFPNHKQKYTIQTLWAERRRQNIARFEYFEQRYEKNYLLRKQVQKAQKVVSMDQEWFIRRPRPGVQNPSPDFYRELMYGLIPEDDDCPICQRRMVFSAGNPESCTGGDFVDATGTAVGGHTVFIPCSHVFGLGCIRRWIEEERHGSCPLCRHDFTINAMALYAEPVEWGPTFEWDMMSIVNKAWY